MGKMKTKEEFKRELSFVLPNVAIVGEYNGAKEKIDCKCLIHNYEFQAWSSNLLRGHGCKKCGNEHRRKAHTMTHSEYLDRVVSVNSNIQVIDRYINSNTKILHKCIKDGYEWYAYPTHILSGHGCPVCVGKVVVGGINDVATNRPDLVDYFENKNIATCISVGSSRRINVVCPYCGYTKSMIMSHLSHFGFSCSVCGDGISYPNKLCRLLLSQIDNLQFECEYQPDWAKPYFYDNYFEYNNQKYIIEMDGAQHFTENNFGRQTLNQIQKIDGIKNHLAESHNITIIRIDCQKSELNYIKNNILNSELSQVFDLSIIDWEQCERQARTSLLYKVCEFYEMSDNKQIQYISKWFGIASPTIRAYLKRGNDIGICSYTPKMSKKSVMAYNIEDHQTFIFDSVSKCAIELSKLYKTNINKNGIHRVCDGIQNLYKSFVFQYNT